jgi:hypothetical protein
VPASSWSDWRISSDRTRPSGFRRRGEAKDCASQRVTEELPSILLAVVHTPASAEHGKSHRTVSGHDTRVRGRAMKSVRACMRPWVCICGLVLAFDLWVSGLASAEAECRYLAARLGIAAACGSAEIRDPTGGTAPPPPPNPPGVVPPPPPQSERISSFRTTWPQSAPWGKDWSKEGWGD